MTPFLAAYLIHLFVLLVESSVKLISFVPYETAQNRSHLRVDSLELLELSKQHRPTSFRSAKRAQIDTPL